MPGEPGGEHDDGSAFDGGGRGRLSPLLTGERAHYELAAGNRSGAERLRQAMSSFAGPGHLLPEQVWDAEPIPKHGLSSSGSNRAGKKERTGRWSL